MFGKTFYSTRSKNVPPLLLNLFPGGLMVSEPSFEQFLKCNRIFNFSSLFDLNSKNYPQVHFKNQLFSLNAGFSENLL